MTECEIFLSLIVKFLDPDKPTWQRALALEVLHKMTVQADLLTNFCECYDLKPHATNIFQDIVNSLGAYVHSLFVNPHMMNQTGTDILRFVLNDYKINVLSVVLLIGFCSNLWQSTTFLLSYPKCVYIFLGYINSLFLTASSTTIPQSTGAPLFTGMPVGPGVSPQPGFYSRGIWLPVVATFTSGQAKPT